MDECWAGVKAVLRIAYSSQKSYHTFRQKQLMLGAKQRWHQILVLCDHFEASLIIA